jgi:hypothetical protein
MRKTEHMQCLKGDSHVQRETVMSKGYLNRGGVAIGVSKYGR